MGISTSEYVKNYGKYISDFREMGNGHSPGTPFWLKDLKELSLQSFEALGFPTAQRGNEQWLHTNVAPIAEKAFNFPVKPFKNDVTTSRLAALLPWDRSWLRMVFVNGRYVRRMSSPLPSGTSGIIGNLAEYAGDGSGEVQAHLAQYAYPDENGFIAINSAFIRDGAFIHLPDNESLSKPLHLIFVTTCNEMPVVTYPRVLVVAGRHSKLTLLESYVNPDGGTYLTDPVVEISAGDGADVEHYRYMAESPEAFYINTTRVVQEKDSRYKLVTYTKGARIARHDTAVTLNAPGASCWVNGLYHTTSTQHIDNHINIDHASPHTTSDQLFKGVLDGQSRAVFSGRVIVRKGAQKTVARQYDRNLILSEGSSVNAKPSMEIFTDDVDCSHGATNGAIDEDWLFYLMSRGLDRRAAKAALIRAFASEVVDMASLAKVRDYLERVFLEVLPDDR